MSGRKPQDVELVSALGFSGGVTQGLQAHPDGVHIVYPLGATLVIKNALTGQQRFLHGHSDRITCVAMSPDGTTLASGQKTHVGFKAKIILWSFADALSGAAHSTLPALREFHTVKVQSLSFSARGGLLASLGGADDNKLAIWSVATGKKVSFAPAGNDSGLTVRFANGREDLLVSAGYHHVRRWTLDLAQEKLEHEDANLGTLRRIVKSVAFSADDSAVFCGTTTGDVLEVALASRVPNFRQAGNELFGKGIRCMALAGDGELLLLGCGDGAVVALDARSLKKRAAAKVAGEVSSLALVGRELWVGTDESNVYACRDVVTLQRPGALELRATCHSTGISDVAFLAGFDGVFVTCAGSDVRVWNAQKQQELLRVQVPSAACCAVALPRAGDMILTAWDDGKIRAFKPVSGELDFIINDAHPKGVTAVAVTRDGRTIVSGGAEGAVRFWDARTRKMLGSLKEHKSAVTSIAVRSDDKECLSSSDDGSCIQWDLASQRRTQAVFAQTMFKAAMYHPDESQLLTAGSDRRLTSWDAFDGTAIRVLEGARDQINALDMDAEGDCFVAGSNDCLVKVFSYDEGALVAQAVGHSGPVTAVKISPDQKHMVSVGAEGAIFVWKFPAGLVSPADAPHK